jgi:hypothetical protein
MKPPITKIELEEMYVVNRMTYKEIAAKFNCSVWQVQQAVKKYSVPPRSPGAMKGKVSPAGNGVKISAALKGKPKSVEHRRKLSESKRGVNHPNFGKKAKGHGKRHWYKCPNGETVSMRSGWEVAYAEYLDNNGVKWLYEPTTFTLPSGNAYTPDFHLLSTGEYVEVKGWLTAEHKRRMADFRNTYPWHTLVLADKTYLISLGIDLTKKWKSSKPLQPCEWCGIIFHRHDKSQRYCGKQCANKAVMQPDYVSPKQPKMSVRKYNGDQTGCNNNSTKLTENQVLAAINLRCNGATFKEITKLTGITSGNMSNILRGVSWTHLTGIKPKDTND